MDAVDAAIESILDPSISWGFYRDLRRSPQVYSRSVPGFPFDIVYFRIDDEVYVVAYAHERRRPATGKIASAADRWLAVESPVGVLASADNTESGVFQMQDRTISAPSAHVVGPVKVERGLHSSVASNPTVSATDSRWNAWYANGFLRGSCCLR